MHLPSWTVPLHWKDRPRGRKTKLQDWKMYFLSKYMHRNCEWGHWAQMLWVFINVLTRPLTLSYRDARKILFSESQGSNSLCNVNWNGGDEYVSSLAIWNKDKQLFSCILGCTELTYEQRKLAQDIFTMSHKKKKKTKRKIRIWICFCGIKRKLIGSF